MPGGVTLLPLEGEDAGRVQTHRRAIRPRRDLSLEQAADLGCRACASPGGGCQFLGTAATSQVVGEALGLSLGHSALSPSGQPIWLDLARRSARALMSLERRGLRGRDILTEASIRNAMVVHAAFGGSTNLLLHVPAIAHAAGLPRPAASDWAAVSRRVPRLVDALPNGPRNHPTVQVFLAGGVPEVMLHLRRAGLLDTSVLTVAGTTLDAQLDAWESSARRTALRQRLRDLDGVDADDVIMSPDAASKRGLAPTMCLPQGNLAPDGAVIKSTAIDPTVVDRDGVFRFTGPAKVFVSEPAAIAAIKSGGIAAGDVLVLICRGPMGAGMEETYQLTSALKYPGLRQARRAADRRALQRRVDRRLHRPHLARSARRRTDRQAARRRHHSYCDRQDTARRHRRLRRHARRDGGAGRRRAHPAPNACHGKISLPIRRFPTTPVCGPRCRT